MDNVAAKSSRTQKDLEVSGLVGVINTNQSKQIPKSLKFTTNLGSFFKVHSAVGPFAYFNAVLAGMSVSHNLINFTLFVATAALTMAFSSIASKGKKLALDQQYVSVLQKLFKPVKLVSRHSNDKMSNNDVVRKSIFNTLYSKYPFSKTCKVVHIAGTKGKGSTVEFISSSLISSGAKVGVFTSPHIHTARERVKIGRNLISKEDMIRLGTKALEVMSLHSWTMFFDCLLAVSLHYFGENDVDYMVLETGIGGRYDSTNFVSNPAACVITSISIDHQHLLGNTREEIAVQKAGIIKKNSHVFTPATQTPGVMEVLKARCIDMDAVLHVVPVSM
jgi:hypothetical protein